MLPGAYRRALDTVSRGVLSGVLALMRAGSTRLPGGEPDDEARAAARDALADQITKLVWDHRRKARDTAHDFLTGQARRAGITGDVYLPNLPGYGTESMRTVLADFDQEGVFGRHPDQIAARVGAVAVRHTEDAARRIVVQAAEADEATVRAWEQERSDRAERQRRAQAQRDWEESREEDERPRSRRAPAQPGGWARMLTGAENCAFCVMLAARGPVYDGKSEALDGDFIGKFGDAYHDNCDCIAVPVYSKQWDGGATAAKLQRLYEKAQQAISDDDLQDRETESPDQLRKLRKYMAEHTDELERIVPDIREDDRLAERQRALDAGDVGEPLDEHEVSFYEQFQAAGERFQLIPRPDNDEHGRRPSSNDFRWERDGSEVELKSFDRPKYEKVADEIQDSVRKAREHGVTKDTFIVYSRRHPPVRSFLRNIAKYNQRRSSDPIRRLFWWDGEKLHTVIDDTKE